MKKEKAIPPGTALRFLRWFCREDYLEEIEGDLTELFEKQSEQSPRRAKWAFFWQVLRYFRPVFIKGFSSQHSIFHTAMFQHYVKIAWRNLLRQKLYSVLNIGGLAIGLTSFLLIFLFVQHELSYDTFYPNADRVYRMYQRQEGNMYLGSDYFGKTPARLAEALKAEFPEVQSATSILESSALIGYEKEFFWEKGMWAGPNIFTVLGSSLMEGNPKRALERPESIVLTNSLALKIFGTRDVLGKTLSYQDESIYTITGIIQDPPGNSSLQYSFITSILSHEGHQYELTRDKWYNNSCHTFFLLANGTNPQAFESKLPEFLTKNVGYDDSYPFKDTYLLQPLTDLHLHTGINADIGLKGNPQYVNLLSLIALIVLLLACVNYMNLAVARSIKRAGEVGMRKVLGAVRGQVISQFLSESVLIALFALVLAIIFTHFLTPVFGALLERPLYFDLTESPLLLPGMLLLVLVVGILAGSYPAFVMSALRPVQVLTGKVGGLGKLSLQRWLIVGQYAISIALVISSTVIFRQFQFIHNRELGYNKDHVLTIRVRDDGLRETYETLKQEWLKNPQVIGVTSSHHLPAHITSSTIINDNDDDQADNLAIYETRVGYDYLDVFGIELVAGRNFSREYASDYESGYLINETAARALGWEPAEAIGQTFTHQETEQIIGVVQDFHMHSMQMEIQPLMLHLRNPYLGFVSVKIRPEQIEETIAGLEASLSAHSSFPFEYQFLDTRFDELYQEETKLGGLFGVFTLLSLFIASLGLFGMAAFRAQQRTKEIGIRKVLGASVVHILNLLSADFLKMVGIGFLIAVPIAWYLMDQWLQDFAYRVEMEWWIFAISGVAAVLIAVLTISSQALKAANVNPAECLRDE